MDRLTLGFADDALPHLVRDADHPCGGWAVELLSWISGLKEISRPVVLSWQGATQVAGPESDVEFIEVWNPRGKGGPLRYFFSFIPKCARALRKNNVDVMIHACAGLATGLYAIAAKLAGKKFVYRVVSDMDVDSRLKTRLQPYQHAIYRLGLNLADAFICQNDYQMECLGKQFPRKPRFKIHNPYLPLKQVRKDASEIPYIAWLGVFRMQKNLPLLARLVKQTPDVHYKVAGMPAKMADAETLAALEVLKRSDNVDCVGYMKRTDVSAFLANARALMNTSHMEGFSNTFLEALAVGTPVITSVGVDPDNIIEQNSLGFVVADEAGYVNAIHKVTSTLYRDDDQQKQRCIDFVQTHHSPKVLSERFVSELREALVLK